MLVIKTGAPEAAVQDLQTLLMSAQNEIKVEGAEVHSNAVDERSSVVLLVKRMIMDAHKQKASDIHIETNPGEEPSRVRFRIDGDLEEYLKLPTDLRAALVSRIKVMSKLDISERRRPQDGKINFSDFSDIKLELRVAILPTHDNLEDVVMRLLASSKPIPLAQLGFSTRDAEIVKRLSQHPYGLFLACGPTGSGKTTTLHSLLSEINTESRKIWTAEDPIEITQSGLRQLQVNPKIGLTFAAAMRAFLRADPDVVMIGEVRDDETARVCIEASLTGHLVFSTLHTNGAAESVVRLLDLGMDPLNFGDSLIGIVAQRLVRSLCKYCATTKVLTTEESDALVHEYIEGTEVPLEEGRKRLWTAASASSSDPAASVVSVHEAVGCERCGGRGYKGRLGIYEVLENVGGMKHKIQTRAPTSEIFAEASRAGMRTLRQDALEKVVAGLIDLPQARTVYA
ncbi:GspE/PulE family protein [Rhodoferax sp.]|uniref:GspE/PulE family protein n=1 Tax=Rhodoferax sp. TaxID=50421 RepID=UPI0025E9D0D7|nr:GspE/PulE family protein [Rhodoferax sp.]